MCRALSRANGDGAWLVAARPSSAEEPRPGRHEGTRRRRQKLFLDFVLRNSPPRLWEMRSLETGSASLPICRREGDASPVFGGGLLAEIDV